MCIIQNIWCKVTQNIGFFVTLHAFIFKPNFYKMKKFYLLSILAAASMTLQAAVFTSSGNGETWTMTKLAAQEEVPVTVDETGKVFTVAENVTISAGDTFQMEDGITIKIAKSVEIDIEGTALMAVNERSLITATEANVAAKYIWIKTADATAAVEVKNLDFEYAALKLSPAFGANISDCTFRYQQASVSNGTASLQLGGVGVGENESYTVKNCTFEYNKRSAIGTASNASVALLIENNTFNYNDDQNLNYPHINVTACDRGVIIRNNTIVGNRDKNLGGGMVVADLMGVTSNAQTLIENNNVSDCRYGIAVYSKQNAIVRDNYLLNNNTEKTPANGGSGINFYEPNGVGLVAKVYRNHIEGSLWGVTVIGCKDVNLGRTDVAEDDENYCPGLNVFINNGNGSEQNGFDGDSEFQRFDLYNNSGNTVYAMNNYWYVAEGASPRVSIIDKEDNPSHGEVIYAPWAGTTATGISTVDFTKSLTGVKYYNLNGVQSATPFQGVNIMVNEYNDGSKTTSKVIR